MFGQIHRRYIVGDILDIVSLSPQLGFLDLVANLFTKIYLLLPLYFRIFMLLLFVFDYVSTGESSHIATQMRPVINPLPTSG